MQKKITDYEDNHDEDFMPDIGSLPIPSPSVTNGKQQKVCYSICSHLTWIKKDKENATTNKPTKRKAEQTTENDTSVDIAAPNEITHSMTADRQRIRERALAVKGGYLLSHTNVI